MRVTVSGPPGSGKTTVARLVAKRLGFELIATGKIFRNQAKEAGMDVHKYNELAERDATIDRDLDDKIVRIARSKDNIVLEGRLAGQLLNRNRIGAFRVFVTASIRTRAERIARRERTRPLDELKSLQSREESERRRYLEYYNIDIGDLSVYDLVVDSNDITAEECSDIILRELRKMKS